MKSLDSGNSVLLLPNCRNFKKAKKINNNWNIFAKHVTMILAIIGAVAAVAGIAFAVYRYMNPKYSDFDGDFDYDEFEDDFEDDDCEDDGVYVKTVK